MPRQALAAARGTIVNRLGSPGFEQNLGDWTVGNTSAITAAGCTLTRDLTEHHSGIASGHIVIAGLPGAFRGLQSETFPAVAGVTYQVAVWVKGSAGAALQLAIVRNSSTGGVNNGVNPSGVWTRYTASFQLDTGSTMFVWLRTTSNVNADFYVDDWEVEVLPSPGITRAALAQARAALGAARIAVA